MTGLAEMLRSYLDDDEIAPIPEDVLAEARKNTWCYCSPIRHDEVAEVTDALADVADGLRQRFATAVGPLTFYSWYDEQAGQLRACLVSRAPTELPFGGAYRATTDASEVIGVAMADPTPSLIPWSELRATSDETQWGDDDSVANERHAAPFPVWVAPVRE